MRSRESSAQRENERETYAANFAGTSTPLREGAYCSLIEHFRPCALHYNDACNDAALSIHEKLADPPARDLPCTCFIGVFGLWHGQIRARASGGTVPSASTPNAESADITNITAIMTAVLRESISI